MPSYHGWNNTMMRLFRGIYYALCLSLAFAVAPLQAEGREQITPQPTAAYEHIVSFDAHARFNTDGSMVVSESIEVLSLGQQIRRGIFRTLPLSWDRPDGKVFSVNYQIKNVLRDGKPEPYSVAKEGKKLTVRIGSAEQTLQPGTYRYEIHYQVDNHFSRFPDWDELYWNVTGNDWIYAIDNASFHLELPEASAFWDSAGKDTRLQSIDIYTGMRGQKGGNAQILPDGSVKTTNSLKKGEGLTVAYTWPRAILAAAPAPEALSPLPHMLLPTLKTFPLWIPVVLLALYYLLWWRKNVTTIGLKMPPVVPLYAPPLDMSPGYLRYIDQRKYDDICFSSHILDLVAKRIIAITQNTRTSHAWFAKNTTTEQWLSLLPEHNPSRLTPQEKQLLSTLFSKQNEAINLSIACQKPMQDAYELLEKNCQDKKETRFRRWFSLIWRGALITLLIPLICGLFFSQTTALMLIPTLLLLLPGMAMLFVLLQFLRNPKGALARWGGAKVFCCLVFGPLLIFSGGMTLFMNVPLTQQPAGYCGAILVALLISLLFSLIAPRYTQQGLNDLAVAKGLKMYLGTAEKHRYEQLYPANQHISHFEAMLPYALALGVGETWANTFAEYLAQTGAYSEAFATADWQQVRHFSRSCRSSSMATQSTSSRSHSGRSYGGSGSSGRGSSGGGAGGGGGGGW